MSGLPNVTNGVASTGAKILISTNLPSLRGVDGALVRPGRTMMVVEFRKLTGEEAPHVRTVYGMPAATFETEREYTLAEVLNDAAGHSIFRLGFNEESHGQAK